MGRWLSADPIGISGGLNLYEFCGSDPLNFVDPSGLCEKKSGYWDRYKKYYQQELDAHGNVLDWAEDLSIFGGLAIAVSLNDMITTRVASEFIKNAPISGALKGGNISARMVNGATAAKAAGRVAVGKASLGVVSKATGVITAGATGYTVGAHIVAAGRALIYAALD